jgi:hypothetical protein
MLPSSLGVLIWECVSGTIPFDYKKEGTEELDVTKIRNLAAQNQMPWKGQQTDPLIRQVVRLVESCCNPRPNVRPSAADVARSLWDIMILSSIKVDPAPPIQEDVKARVSEMLEKMPSIGLKLLDEDVEDLQDLVSQGDPTAAFLLGSAIWSGLAPPPDGVDQFLVVAGTDHGKGESRQRWTCLHVGAPR